MKTTYWTWGDMALFEFKYDVESKRYDGSIRFEKDKKYELMMSGFGDEHLSVRIDNKEYKLGYKDIYKITRIKDDTYQIYGVNGECIEQNYKTKEYYHPSFYDNGEY